VFHIHEEMRATSAAKFSSEALNFEYLVFVTESTFSDWCKVVQCRDIGASISKEFKFLNYP